VLIQINLLIVEKASILQKLTYPQVYSELLYKQEVRSMPTRKAALRQNCSTCKATLDVGKLSSNFERCNVFHLSGHGTDRRTYGRIVIDRGGSHNRVHFRLVQKSRIVSEQILL